MILENCPDCHEHLELIPRKNNHPNALFCNNCGYAEEMEKI